MKYCLGCSDTQEWHECTCPGGGLVNEMPLNFIGMGWEYHSMECDECKDDDAQLEFYANDGDTLCGHCASIRGMI